MQGLIVLLVFVLVPVAPFVWLCGLGLLGGFVLSAIESPLHVASTGSACRVCGYSTRGLTGDTCPECGADIDRGEERRVAWYGRPAVLVAVFVSWLLLCPAVVLALVVMLWWA